MKKFVCLAIVVTLTCCQIHESRDPGKEAKKESRFKNLLSKYASISFDTLEVYSGEALESDRYKYKGKQLDSADVALFPAEFVRQYAIDPGFYACYRFALDNRRMGLITRTPSIYEPSSVKLLVYDKRTDSITGTIELADAWGDAGDVQIKTSWLFRDKGKGYRSFTWVKESHDNSLEDEKDTTVQVWNYYSLLDLSKGDPDTLSKNDKELMERFGGLVRTSQAWKYLD